MTKYCNKCYILYTKDDPRIGFIIKLPDEENVIPYHEQCLTIGVVAR